MLTSDGIQLAGTSWRVEDVAGFGVVDGVAPTMEFDHHGSVHGSASVNRYAATFHHDAASITFGPALGTRMAGPAAAMRQEQRFLAALGGARSLRWEAPHLYVDGVDDHGQPVTLRLVRTDDGEPFAPVPSLVLRGTALYRERIALPPDAVLLVSLIDTARADAVAELVATTEVRAPGQVPIEFELLVPAAQLGGGRRLALRAHIEIDGQLEWTTDAHHVVTSSSFDEPVPLLLVRVPSPA